MKKHQFFPSPLVTTAIIFAGSFIVTLISSMIFMVSPAQAKKPAFLVLKRAPAGVESVKEGEAKVKGKDTEKESREMEEEDPLASQESKAPKRFISLTLGIEQDVRLSKMPNYLSFKGDFKKIANASYSKESNTLRLDPVHEGKGVLTIHDKTGKILYAYHIEVRKSQMDGVLREMRYLLGDIEGIHIRLINNRVVVDGQILLPRDMTRIYTVVNQFGDQASSIVTLSPMAQKKIVELIKRDLQDSAISVRAVNDKIILEGEVGDNSEKDRAEIIAKSYLPSEVVDPACAAGVVKCRKPANDGIINLLTLRPGAPAPPEKVVQMVVHYVELQKEYSKDFRFQFMPTIDDSKSGVAFQSSSSSAGGIISSITGVISNLLPKLNWAKSHGHARILEATSVMVKEGKSGSIDSRQQVGFINGSMGDKGTIQTPVDVGISASITPTILGGASQTINLEMKFSASNLIGMAGDSPLKSENKVDTSVIVRNGQSAAVGGLITNRSSTDYNRLPRTNGNNPIISLYASKDFVRNQSQFVVFITPVIKSTADVGADKIKRKFRLRE